MNAIRVHQFGGPEVLTIEQRPDPEPTSDQVLIEVKAFGLNHAECYFRSGAWGDVAEITGIECAGIVRTDPGGQFGAGEMVVAIVGGMGRILNGSYAELVAVPRGNVAAIKTDLSWDELAAMSQVRKHAAAGLDAAVRRGRRRRMRVGALDETGQEKQGT